MVYRTAESLPIKITHFFHERKSFTFDAVSHKLRSYEDEKLPHKVQLTFSSEKFQTK